MDHCLLRAIPAVLALAVAAGCAVQSHVDAAARRLDRTAKMIRYEEPSPASEPPAPQGPDWATIGTSVRGKPIRAATIGNGPRRIWILGGLHGDRPDGPGAVKELAAMLLHTPATGAATFRLVPDGNPDGSTLGSRTNTRGVDLDRNWPTKSYRAGGEAGIAALSELETAAIHEDLETFCPDLVILLDTVSFGPFLSYSAKQAGTAYTFASGARATDPRWRVTGPSDKAPAGSLAALLDERHVPVLILTLRSGEPAAPTAKALLSGLEHLLGAAR